MRRIALLLIAGLAPVNTALLAQRTQPRAPGQQSSLNMRLMSHIPLGGAQPLLDSKFQSADVEGLGRRTCDIEVEQELSRPYAYVCSRFAPSGFYIIEFKDPAKAHMLWHWTIENADIHRGSGALNPAYVKTHGRYYMAIATQFQMGGPGQRPGRRSLRRTRLPDTTKIKEIGRIKIRKRPVVFTRASRTSIRAACRSCSRPAPVPSRTCSTWTRSWPVYSKQGLVGRVPLPDTTTVARHVHAA